MDAKLKMSPHEAFARPHAAPVIEELASCQRLRKKMARAYYTPAPFQSLQNSKMLV
jgi:hypothetical protein